MDESVQFYSLDKTMQPKLTQHRSAIYDGSVKVMYKIMKHSIYTFRSVSWRYLR